MDFQKIYQEHLNQGGSLDPEMGQIKTRLMQELKEAAVPFDTLLAFEEQVNHMLDIQEACAFRDGFRSAFTLFLRDQVEAAM